MSQDKQARDTAPATWTAQGLGLIDETTRALVPAIHPSTTYERDKDGGYSSGRGYTRPHNPTYDEPEEMIRRLEGGADCLLTSSGMSAATTVLQSLWPGDHVIAPRVMYWALRGWLVNFGIGWGLDVEFIDTSDLDALAAAVRPGQTQLVWLETPANPTWDVSDIAGAAEIAHGAGARLAVDSTVATPVLTRPIEHGADLIIHSATKYLNGHSDVLAGAIVTAEEDAFWNRVKACRRDGGAVLGPFEAWLLQRGMRTLFVRVQRSCENAMAIAEHFADHPKVSVLYPGLEDHPGHAVASRQMSGGFGGMLSLRHRHGEAAAVETAARVDVFKRATSLGGVESLIEHRASIEGPSTPVPRDLLRLSAGLEQASDLIDDLEAALDHDTGSNSAVSVAVTEPAASAAATGANAVIEKLLREQIHTLVADRGCELSLDRFEDGVVTLAVSGSPGASHPVRANIERLLMHYLPEVTEVRFGGALERSGDATGSTAQQIERLLDEQINPSVAGHGGHVRLAGFEDGNVRLEMGGRCQGCAMASVTLRQGIEPILRESIADIATVVDVTDHQAGPDPYFKTKKGGN